MPVYSVKAHKEIVNSIDGVGGLGIGDGAPEIVTGSRDGIRCFSLNVKKKNTFKIPRDISSNSQHFISPVGLQEL